MYASPQMEECTLHARRQDWVMLFNSLHCKGAGSIGGDGGSTMQAVRAGCGSTALAVHTASG